MTIQLRLLMSNLVNAIFLQAHFHLKELVDLDLPYQLSQNICLNLKFLLNSTMLCFFLNLPHLQRIILKDLCIILFSHHEL